MPPVPAPAVSIGWNGGLDAAEKAHISSIPCPCPAQNLSEKFPAGVSYHKAPLHFCSRPAGSESAVLPQSKSVLSFSFCPASGQTKSSQNTVHAAQTGFPFLSPAFAYGNYIIQSYPLHSWYRRSIVLSRLVRYDDCSW